MLTERLTLTQFLAEDRRRRPGSSEEIDALIGDVALACKAISKRIASGALSGVLGAAGEVHRGLASIQTRPSQPELSANFARNSHGAEAGPCGHRSCPNPLGRAQAKGHIACALRGGKRWPRCTRWEFRRATTA